MFCKVKQLVNTGAGYIVLCTSFLFAETTVCFILFIYIFLREGFNKRQKLCLSVWLFDFIFLILNILKEADINFFFKVLAKFGDNKHKKDIKKNCRIKKFFSWKIQRWSAVRLIFWLQLFGSKHFKRSRYQFCLQSSRQIWW